MTGVAWCLAGLVALGLWRDEGGMWWLEVRPAVGWQLNEEAGPGRALRVWLEGGEALTGARAEGWPQRAQLALGRGASAPRGEVEVLLCAAGRCARVKRALSSAEATR